MICLIVCPEGHFVWVNLVSFHIVVDLFDLILKPAGTTCLKESSVYDLNVSHWVEFLVDICEHPLAEDYQLFGMTWIHRKCGCKDLEPQDIDYLCEVPCPF